MRPFETLILLMLAPVLVGFLFRRNKRPGWLHVFSWCAMAFMLLHLWLEKYRWQMAPAYLMVLLVSALSLRKPSSAGANNSRPRAIGRIAMAGVGLLVWALTAFLAFEIPVFHDPEPSGPFPVGSARLDFVDRSREDPFAPAPHAPRELLVVAWYPADVATGAEPEPFWPEAPQTWPALAHQLRLPSFLAAHLRLVKSHSYPEAPVAHEAAQYPVLIFSHGYAGTPRQNTRQMEELASHGFIVFSLGHTYESAAIAFPDGRVVPLSWTRFSAVTKAGKSEAMEKLNERLRAASSSMEIRQIATEMTRASGAQESLAVWVADTHYLLDELVKLNAGSIAGATEPRKRFANRLDLAHIGIFGMSFGGATAGMVCMLDPRCKAGLNMDGKQSGDVTNHKLAVPFLYFSSESSKDDRKINDSIYEDSTSDFYSVHVNHSAHGNFTDASLILPILKHTPVLGSIGGQEIERIMNAYTVAFFQTYLQAKPATLLEGPPPPGEFPEVIFAAHRAPRK